MAPPPWPAPLPFQGRWSPATRTRRGLAPARCAGRRARRTGRAGRRRRRVKRSTSVGPGPRSRGALCRRAIRLVGCPAGRAETSGSERPTTPAGRAESRMKRSSRTGGSRSRRLSDSLPVQREVVGRVRVEADAVDLEPRVRSDSVRSLRTPMRTAWSRDRNIRAPMRARRRHESSNGPTASTRHATRSRRRSRALSGRSRFVGAVPSSGLSRSNRTPRPSAVHVRPANRRPSSTTGASISVINTGPDVGPRSVRHRTKQSVRRPSHQFTSLCVLLATWLRGVHWSDPVVGSPRNVQVKVCHRVWVVTQPLSAQDVRRRPTRGRSRCHPIRARTHVHHRPTAFR